MSSYKKIVLFCISAELSGLLKTPLIPVGFSGKYPTKTGALIMPGIRGKFNYFSRVNLLDS